MAAGVVVGVGLGSSTSLNQRVDGGWSAAMNANPVDGVDASFFFVKREVRGVIIIELIR